MLSEMLDIVDIEGKKMIIYTLSPSLSSQSFSLILSFTLSHTHSLTYIGANA